MACLSGELASDAASVPGARPSLRAVADFGANPGNLDMWLLAPTGSPNRRRPIVVVLHGCAQTAAGYDAASGWSRLAEAHDFLLVYPEQRRANNEGACFSWFEPGDTRRGLGEVESIGQMVRKVIADFGGDDARVFVCGLSAGGAMAGAMLAAYPEVFQAGAIIAGLPYGTASNVSDAYDSMRTGKIKDAKAWGDLIRAAAPCYAGSWPSVAIWHGTEDAVVRPINAGELVKQWTNVHGLGAIMPAEDQIGRVKRRRWSDANQSIRVIEYVVPGLGHGAPVEETVPPAPFFLPAGISSTRQIADDWGLTVRKPPKSFMARFGF